MSLCRIYTIVVTYNAMQWIDRCLSSLRLSSVSVVPVIVDNGSQDNTVEYIRTHFPEAIVLEQKKNLGFGQGNNKGIEYALANNATHVLLLNQDASIRPDTIDKMLAHDDGMHLLSPVHLNGSEDHIDRLFYQHTLIESAATNGLIENLLLNGKANTCYDVEYVNAACWLLPISMVRRIGGFNPLFTHYGEDDNYIQRIHFHRMGVRLVTNAFIAHDRNAHGNEKIYQRGVFYRKRLLIETNIGLSHKERFLLRHKSALQEFGHAIKTHNLYAFICDCVQAGIKICTNSHAIRISRQTESSIAANWLQV